MPHPLPIDQHGFIRFADVRAQGRQAELRAAVARGEVEVARRGVYRAAPSSPPRDGDLGGAAEQGRLAYRSEVRAVAYAFTSPVFTSYSAAVLLGLPIIGAWPSEVFILSRGEHGRRRSGVVEVARTRPIAVVEIDDCLVTSVEFTLLQLARHAPLVAALTATDAALRVPRFGDAAPLTTLQRLRAEHERLKPYPRSRRADAVLDRATPLADTPLESGSRLLIEELGFATPELQHELWLPELGRRAFLDFYWPEVGVGAEADGRGKYRGAQEVRRDSSSRGGTSHSGRPAEALSRSARPKVPTSSPRPLRPRVAPPTPSSTRRIARTRSAGSFRGSTDGTGTTCTASAPSRPSSRDWGFPGCGARSA